jgi:hypothetical protein
MKSLLIVFASFSFLAAIWAAPIKVTIFGSGGIIHTGTVDKICPNGGDAVCAIIEMARDSYDQYQNGNISVLPATLYMGDLRAAVDVVGITNLNVEINEWVVFETPELNGIKVSGQGTASDLAVKFLEPVNLVPADNNTPHAGSDNSNPVEDPQFIKINIHGSGGASVSSNGKPKLCPNRDRAVCATVEGNVFDLIAYALRPANGNNDNNNSNNTLPVNIKVYDQLGNYYSTEAYLVGINPDFPITWDNGFHADGEAFEIKFR